MDEGLDLSRREFMQVGAVSLLEINSASQQISQQTQPREEYEFQGVADLMGPLAARPEPNSDFFNNKQYYWYRYEATDAGRYFISQDDDQWTNISIMEQYETQFGFPAVRNATNKLDVPAEYDFNTGRHLLIVNGTKIQDLSNTSKFVDASGYFQIQASGGDTIQFGARELSRYVPNFEKLWGACLWLESQLSSGQSVYAEFTPEDRQDGYQYHFNGDGDHELIQLSGGTPVDSVSQSNWETDPFSNGLSITEPFIPRDFIGWYGGGESRYTLAYPDSTNTMQNTLLGRTANRDGIATEQINATPKIVVDLDSGASSLTVNIGSFGTLIQGSAEEFDREKIGTHWDLGGSISQYPSENDPVLALRIDPNRADTAVQLPTPVFGPSSETMGMTVYGVLPGDTDADFLDVDGDGTNEGPAYAAQTQGQNNVIQWTRNVSTFPTTSGQRMDNTSGQIVDARQISSAVSVGSGNKNDPPVPSAGRALTVKRILFPGEIALFIPRTDPTSSTTSGSIDFLQEFSEQDW